MHGCSTLRLSITFLQHWSTALTTKGYDHKTPIRTSLEDFNDTLHKTPIRTSLEDFNDTLHKTPIRTSLEHSGKPRCNTLRLCIMCRPVHGVAGAAADRGTAAAGHTADLQRH